MELVHLGVFLLPIFALVYGHGNMVKPMAWWDANQDGWYYNDVGHEANLGCCTLNLPQDTQFTNHSELEGVRKVPIKSEYTGQCGMK